MSFYKGMLVLRGAAYLTLVATTAALSGCGTVAYCLPDGHDAQLRPYGGVALDAQALERNCRFAVSGGENSGLAGLYAALYTVDLAFSTVGDTALLPVTLPCFLGYYVRHLGESPSPGLSEREYQAIQRDLNSLDTQAIRQDWVRSRTADPSQTALTPDNGRGNTEGNCVDRLPQCSTMPAAFGQPR
jgi:uncharacterized protein YceK